MRAHKVASDSLDQNLRPARMMDLPIREAIYV